MDRNSSLKQFFRRLLILLFIFITIATSLVFISSYIVSKRGFRNYNTESCLLTFKNKKHYDIALMGISHARIFSRDHNHQRVEKILGVEMLNISRTGASCGVNEQNFYLSYVYSKDVKIGTIIYFASPSLIFGGHLNKYTNTFEIEPFKLDFFCKYLNFKSEVKYERLFYYYRSKLTPDWWKLKPQSLNANTKQLTNLDSVNVNKGLELTYSFGDTYKDFENNCLRIEEAIILAHKQKSNFIFIIPPALFGKWPNHEYVIKFLEKMEIKHKIKFYDFSESILDPQYYYDSHHLNTYGIIYFTSRFLKPILNQRSK